MALQLDAQTHDLLVLRLRQWATEHYSSIVAADVITGTQSRRVAEGHIVDIQEHPTRHGVYRVLFDSHLDPAATETGQDAVLFGWEVTDVTGTPIALDIAKGTAQRIVLTDLSAQAEDVARADALTPAVAPAAAPPPPIAPPPVAPAPIAPAPIAPAAPRQRARPSVSRVLLYVAAAFAIAFAVFVMTRDDAIVAPPVDDAQIEPLSEFSAAERRLLGHVPWGAADCRPAAARGDVVASVVCKPAGEQATVRYARYATSGQLERTWERLRERRNAAGSGATDWEYGTWCTIAIGECRISDGFYVLFRQDGKATAQWTHTELRIMATAQRDDGRLEALRGFWQRSGPSE